MKLAVIYDSKSGNTKKCAMAIIEGMNKAEGIEAKAFHISDVDSAYVKECAGTVFGCPTYGAGPSSDFYTWFEKNTKDLNLAGKLGGAFATGQYIHGGEDLVIETLLMHMMVKGMMVYSGGGAFGKPVIHVGPVAISPDTDSYHDLFVTYGERFALQTLRVFGK